MATGDAQAWSASGSHGVVAAGHPDAVAAGLSILGAGGNAADAAVATILALSVTDYGMFALGGEVPFMFCDATNRKVTVLSGQGGAPLAAEAMCWYATNGIPATGGILAAAVPGAPDLCLTALRLYGTLSFAAVVAPTLALLEGGAASWHRPLALTLGKMAAAEAQEHGSREQKLAAARDRFYRGDLAAALERFYVANGSFLRRADLAAHTTHVEEPVAVRYADHTVYKCGPWTQGPCLCQALRLLEGFDLKGMGQLSGGYIHTVAEALKLALADRDEFYGDPRFLDVPLAALLADGYTALRRRLIDPGRAALAVTPGDPFTPAARKAGAWAGEAWVGGTTTCVVSDAWGNVVAATPSANPPYAVCEELGLAHGTRLSSLNTTPGHPNRIAPGKRPRITLTPTIAVRTDGSVLAISVAGGDLQEQTTLNCLLNHVEFHMDPAAAVTAPRFSTQHHQDSFNPATDRTVTLVTPAGLTLDARLSDAVVSDLAQRGHVVTRTAEPVARPVMLHLDSRTGLARAASVIRVPGAMPARWRDVLAWRYGMLTTTGSRPIFYTHLR